MVNPKNPDLEDYGKFSVKPIIDDPKEDKIKLPKIGDKEKDEAKIRRPDDL